MPGAEVTPGEHRPPDLALRQQRLKAWKPVLDPTWVIATLVIIAAIFIPVGFKMRAMSNNVVEIRQEYDAHDDPAPLCGINDTANARKKCTLEFTVPEDMEAPVLVHYEISGFYQNQRRYAVSRDDAQLLGATEQTELAMSTCKPLDRLGNMTLNPCGLIANTLFNDVFTLSSSSPAIGGDGAPLAMIEEGIAWQTDLEFKFRQPDGFRYEQCVACDDANCTCDSAEWTCAERGPYKDKNGNCFLYYYPNAEKTRYLYETYDMVVNPIEGVTNEHFVVWMRTAALPTFRKLYGWFDQPITAGSVLTFDVEANWEVSSFRGSKALVISNNNVFGGKNDHLGKNFVIVGIICLGFAAIFWLKHTFRRRKLADKNYLFFKED